MDFLWEMINTFQIIAFMPLLTFKMPGFLLVFFRYLNFMNFRFNDQKAYIAKHYDFTTSMEEDGITHYVAGFDTSNVFINLYDLLVFFLIGCPIILIILLSIYFISCLNFFPAGNAVSLKTQKMLGHIRYNSLIRISIRIHPFCPCFLLFDLEKGLSGSFGLRGGWMLGFSCFNWNFYIFSTFCC